MENTEVQHPWEQQDDELEEGLITRRKNHNQTPVFITINADFSSNNVASVGVTNGKHHHQQEEQENEDEVKDFVQPNGIKVDEDEKEKEKQEISQYSVYYDTDKGNGLHSESSLVEENGVDSDAHGKTPMPEDTNITKHIQDNVNGLHSVISNQNGEHHKHEILFEEIVRRPDSDINNKTDTTDIQLIKDGDDETTEYDVETVLKKQDTHDLFCPNCNSCITKRVILRKRKRRIRVTGDDAKRNKPEVNVVRSEVNVVLDVEPPITNEFDNQREPDVFRCLSCFSIFMPTGNGFKLFRMFGNKNNEEHNEGSQKEVPVKKNWFSNFFASKEEELNNQGSVQSLDMENNASGLSRQEASTHNTNGTTELDKKQLQSAISSVGRDENAPLSSTQESIALEQQIAKESDNNRKERNGRIEENSLAEKFNNKSEYPGMFVVKPAENAVSPLQHDGLRLLVPPNLGSLITENSQINQELGIAGQMYNPGLDEKERISLIFSPLAATNGQSNLDGQINDLGLQNNLAINGKEQNTYKDRNIVPEVTENSNFQNSVEILLDEPLKVSNDVLTVKLIEEIYNTEIIKGLDEKGRISLSFSPLASNNGQSNLGGQINDLGLQNNLAINGKEQKTYKDKTIEPEVTEQHSLQYNVEILLDEPLKVDKDVLTDKQIKLLEEFNNIERVKGKDAVITIESKQPDASSLQRLGETGTSALQQVQTGSQAVQQGSATTATGGGRSVDIIKSIVYGGLIELITSLSVVSSAAGADAATLNVLALGLANIFGGLFVIIHDLWDLKNERTRKTEDRYQLLLGQRKDFPLHMVVSLISYLVFGFLPPVVYGFSFQASNDKDLKLLTVAGASIVCIMILAAAKAYIQSPRKSIFKTISYYVVFGFIVSGVSCLFGSLIMKLLEKMDILQPGSVDNLSIHGVSSNPALVATY